MICSIHQPNYIPYLWLFHKINGSDVFVFYDNAQYTKWDYHNRNKIKGSNWDILLTIPVNVSLWDKINEVNFNNKILKKHLKSIEQSYKKAKYYNEVIILLSEIFWYKWNSLSEFNIDFIKKISNYLWINTNFKILSELDINLNSSSTDALIDICKSIWADEYISWSWWKNYIEKEKFLNNWIKLKFQDFKHPIYNQLWWDFIPYMSIIDLLFNEWKNSINLLE
jgi:hypothetical protein